MSELETPSPEPTVHRWAFRTPYDAVHRRAWGEILGDSNERIRDIDAYFDYINNEMDESSLIYTDTNKISYTLTTGQDERVTLYRKDADGQLMPFRDIKASGEFVGNAVRVQDGEVYVLHKYHNLAVRAINLIKILPTGTDSVVVLKRRYDAMIEKGYPEFDLLEPYEGVIFPSTTD